MRSPAQVTVLFRPIVVGIAGCHKQAPPVTQAAPVTSSGVGAGGPGIRESSPAASVRPASSEDATAEAARRKAATAVMAQMIHVDYNGGRMDVSSPGREPPLDPGHTNDAWTRNRRDEFMILSGSLR